MTGAQLACNKWMTPQESQGQMPFVPQRNDQKTLGTDADPLANKGEWEKRLSKVSKQHQFKH